MKYTEFQIREKIAANLQFLDSHLELISQEYSLRLDDGRQAFIDILARDVFGCYTIIEIKKSNKSSRTTIQQLYKYASFFKAKRRLEDHQIRLMVISTDWDELSAPFSEFKKFSPYESIGYKLTDVDNLSFELVDPPFVSGNCNPLANFYLFRFSDIKVRDEALVFINKTIKRIPSFNNYIFILNANSENSDSLILYDMLDNPYAIAIVSFTGDYQSALEESAFLDVSVDSLNELDLALLNSYETKDVESKIRTALILHLNNNIDISSLKAYAPHTLNNLFNVCDEVCQFGLGPMFNEELFSKREIIDICNGYFGLHPYIFRCITTPQRIKHFNEFRLNVNDFLINNNKWKLAVNHIVDSVDETDTIEIEIFNTLNFYGLLNDFYCSGNLSRKPYLIMRVKNKDKEQIFSGTIMWNGFLLAINSEPFVLASYPTIHAFRARSVMQTLTDYDSALSDMHGISHEVFDMTDKTIFDPSTSSFITNNKFEFDSYLSSHVALITSVGELFSKYKIGVNNNNTGMVIVEST